MSQLKSDIRVRFAVGNRIRMLIVSGTGIPLNPLDNSHWRELALRAIHTAGMKPEDCHGWSVDWEVTGPEDVSVRGFFVDEPNSEVARRDEREHIRPVTARHKSERLLVRLSSIIPRRHREHLTRDLWDDLEEFRADGWTEKELKRLVWWQFAIVLKEWLKPQRWAVVLTALHYVEKWRRG